MKDIKIYLNEKQNFTKKKPGKDENQIVLKALNDDRNKLNEVVYNISKDAEIDDIIKAINFMIGIASEKLDKLK